MQFDSAANLYIRLHNDDRNNVKICSLVTVVELKKARFEKQRALVSTKSFRVSVRSNRTVIRLTMPLDEVKNGLLIVAESA
jgi:hypothetical protein